MRHHNIISSELTLLGSQINWGSQIYVLFFALLIVAADGQLLGEFTATSNMNSTPRTTTPIRMGAAAHEAFLGGRQCRIRQSHFHQSFIK